MLLIREVFHCKPGKVRALTEKFHAMAKLSEQAGLGITRITTDFSGLPFWTLVIEFEVASITEFEEMLQGKGMTDEMSAEFQRLMQGYHDLIDHGHREIYKIEEAPR